ncbi:MAG: geranylgeranyl reductase family protein [Vicinamibacterales bacterium]
MSKTDVIVVGAGPAGAWAAYCLARRGARVTVFDHSHPREKPCGGGLTRRALNLVTPAIGSLDGVDVARGLFDDPRTRPAAVDLEALDRRSSLLIVSRRLFDARLLQAACDAGAEHRRERVVDVIATPHGAKVTTDRSSHAASWLIGADGANSLVRRRLQQPFRRDQLSIASGVYAHGRTAQEIVIRFVTDPPGYIWSFPRTDHLAIGICAQADVAGASQLRRVLHDWLAASGLGANARLERYAWPIPSLSAHDFATARPAGQRHLLIGDAAGLVDPITREGIFFALQSAALAADALCVTKPADNTYCAALRDDMLPELRSAARLKQGFFRGPFTRLMVDAIRHSRGVQRVAADLIMGAQSYRALKLRLLRTWEWRLAWQLVRLGREPS